MTEKATIDKHRFDCSEIRKTERHDFIRDVITPISDRIEENKEKLSDVGILNEKFNNMNKKITNLETSTKEWFKEIKEWFKEIKQMINKQEEKFVTKDQHKLVIKDITFIKWVFWSII